MRTDKELLEIIMNATPEQQMRLWKVLQGALSGKPPPAEIPENELPEVPQVTNPLALPPNLLDFINSAKWTFAKTYVKWPHEYIVRDRVDESLFVQLVEHIRAHGYAGKFYRMSITYFDEGVMTYWTMGEPLADTKIVNRCPKAATYEVRLKNGTLPPDKERPAAQGPAQGGGQ